MVNRFSLEKLVRPNIARLKPYSSARDEFKDFAALDMVFLDANENPYENGVNRYPDPQQRNLKSILADQKGVNANQILLGNGSDEVLDLLFRAFCEPQQDNVITLPPTYGMYKVLANINNVEEREVVLTENFEPNVDAILQAVDSRTKMIFLCSPNNPTGNVFSVDSVLRLLNEFDGFVVIDEAYIDFSEKQSWLARINEFPNLIISQTLSKAYGMAGIRIGLCFASAEVINILNKIKPPYNINELSQLKAIERVVDTEGIKKEVASIIREKQVLEEALIELPYVQVIYPSEANFVLAKVDDANKRYDQLIEKGVVIRNRTTQELCENCLRFTVGTPEENEKLINALSSI
ncbi:MAG: histidinol-phosphate transaminase [Flavobacteriales bacterium]|nr:histidinol-phosphate transaminase [Flavobacteriales bacterium]